MLIVVVDDVVIIVDACGIVVDIAVVGVDVDVCVVDIAVVVVDVVLLLLMFVLLMLLSRLSGSPSWWTAPRRTRSPLTLTRPPGVTLTTAPTLRQRTKVRLTY